MKILVTALAAVAFNWVSLPAQDTTPAERIFNHASEALKSGDYEMAESGFKQVLRLEPRNISAMSNLGTVYSRTMRYAKAIEIYKQALRISPQVPGILLNLGLAYLKQDDYSRALPYLRRLHSRDPGNVQAINLLATCLVYGGQPAAALDLLKALEDKKPDPATLYLLGVAYTRAGQAEAGEKVFAKLLTDTTTKAQASFVLAQAYYDSARFDEAEKAFNDALAANPQLPGAHRELAKVYMSIRHNEDAEKELRMALDEDSNDANAMYFFGALLVQTGQYEKAVPYLEHVHKGTPDSWAAAFYLGKAKFKLNDVKASVLLLQEAAEMNADEPAIFYLLASALRAAGRNEEAGQALRRVSDLHTNSLDAEKRALRDANVVGTR